MWPFQVQQAPEQLNICIVGSRFPMLGKSAEEGFLWPLARGLAAKGHKVTIISWQSPMKRKKIVKDRIRAYFVGEGMRVPRADFPILANDLFEQLHSEEAFHIVHSLDSSAQIIASYRKDYNVSVMFDVAATQLAQIFSILAMSQESLGGLLQTGAAVVYKFLTTFHRYDRRILKNADGVFVTTPYQKIALERYYLYPELKTFIIPYGSEFIDLTPREKSDELRQELNIPINSKNVLTVTDMTEVNEIAKLLRAFAKVVIKKPSSRMIIVGNGPLFKEIEFEVLSLALGSKVIFTGAVSNEILPDYIALSDVFVNLSSRTSGFEPSTLEAMVLEKVVVGSELSPISTIIEDGVDGFLIRPADVQELSRILNGIFSDQLPAKSIGQQARAKILEIFKTERMVEELEAAYKKTISNTGRGLTKGSSKDFPRAEHPA